MRRFFRKRLPAFLLTLVMVMTMVPAVSARSSADLTYEVDKGESVSFRKRDFRSLYRNEYSNEEPRYIVFTDYSDLDDYGYLTAKNYRGRTISLSESDLNNTWFYYDSDNVPESVDYALDDLTFEANRRADSGTLRMEFEIHGERSKDYVSCTMDIKVGGGSGSSKGDITYTVKAGEEVAFDDEDFVNAYDNAGGSGTMKYVVFEKPSSDYSNAGTVYSRYGKRNATSFTRSELDDYKFYYGDSDYGDYDLDELSFVADKSFSGSITLNFTVYGGTGTRTNQNATGTLVITTGTSAVTSRYVGNIRYNTTPNTALQINANDIARLFRKYTSGGSLQYLTLTSVPATGSLYYNYYNASKYGATRTQLTASMAGSMIFSYSPASASEYDLSELTYIPSGSNYCTALTFTGYSSSGTAVSATIPVSYTHLTLPTT